MKRRKTGRPVSCSRQESLERARERQRTVCIQLLERFVPVAVRRQGSGTEPGEENGDETLEVGFKAGAFVLKILERMARLDGLDAAEKSDVTVSELADPLELAKRVAAVSPVLMERLRLGDLTKE